MVKLIEVRMIPSASSRLGIIVYMTLCWLNAHHPYRYLLSDAFGPFANDQTYHDLAMYQLDRMLLGVHGRSKAFAGIFNENSQL